MPSMKRIAISVAAGMLSAAVGNAPAWAHHSGAMFDMFHCKTISGTVRVLQWSYPHNWLWVDQPLANGTQAVWGFEFMSPTQAENIDPLWSRDVMKKGDKVTVKFGPLRDGRNGGALAWVLIPSGHTLHASPGLCTLPPGGAPGGPPP